MPNRFTPNAEIDGQLAELAAAKSRLAGLPLAERIRLAESCVEGTFRLAREWLAAACEAKGIALDSPLAGEELATGPLATTRYLQLLARSLKEIEAFGRPQLHGEVVEDVSGRLRIQVFPARGMYD